MIPAQIAVDCGGWPVVLDVVVTSLSVTRARVELVRTPTKKGPKVRDVVGVGETLNTPDAINMLVDRLADTAAEKLHKTNTMG